MADILSRPHTSLGHYSDHYVDTETKLANTFVLAPGFRKTLNDFYPKASAEDKARCLELLTSLDIAENLKEQAQDTFQHSACYSVPEPPKTQRPKSAMAARYPHKKIDIRDPYTTSYEVNYQENEIPVCHPERPSSTKNFNSCSYNLSGPIGVTNYQRQFHKKTGERPSYFMYEPKRNVPHPLETFMVWKLPKNPGVDPANQELRNQLTNEIMELAMRGKSLTTYQTQYLGMQQGESGIQAIAPKTKLPNPCYTLDSTARHSYQEPLEQTETKGNTTRYGCNKKKQIAAFGAVPTMSRKFNTVHMKNNTTYDREYYDRFYGKPVNVRDLAKEHGTASLQRHYARAKAADRPMIGTMMNTMSNGWCQPINGRPSSTGVSSRASSSHVATPGAYYGIRHLETPDEDLFDVSKPTDPMAPQ